jgi:DNA polymerase-3 subunit delta
VFSPLLNADIREDALAPCYFLYGEETFLADEFIDQLRETLAGPSGEDFHVDHFYLDETKWMDITDAARTAPFLFHSWRVIAVRVPERKPGGDKGSWKRGDADEDEVKTARFLGETDQKILREYCAEPQARTVLVVVMPGKVRKNDTVVRFFSSLPRSAVVIRELKPLYPNQLRSWADRKAQSLGKSLTAAAKDRLLEVVGSDLRLLGNELDKLAIFVGERRGIDEDDVNEATGWLRSFEVYELDEALAGADFGRGVAVLGNLFSEGERPEMIVARLATYFRNVLTAQTWLREKSRSRDEIFQHFFPYIKAGPGEFYRTKFNAFFSVVEGLSRSDLNSLLRGLSQADVKIKTSDADERTVLEIFLKSYALLRGRKESIARE